MLERVWKFKSSSPQKPSQVSCEGFFIALSGIQQYPIGEGRQNMSDKQNQSEKTETDELPVCTKSFDPESQRLQDDDSPCVDGENRDQQ